MLSNQEMKAGRFARLARARKLYRRMHECWSRGGFVRIGTATRYSDLYAKHADLILIGKPGSIYWRRGKRTECLDFCSFQFTA